jgi:predicted nucleic acid-binding protein
VDRLVLDASVLAKWVLPGEPWERQALSLKAKLTGGEVEVYAPSIANYELASLLLRALNSGRMRLEDAKQALKLFERLNIKIYEADLLDMAEIFDTAYRINATIYDAAYVWLAGKLNASLVTADRELAEKARKRIAVKHLGEIPI